MSKHKENGVTQRVQTRHEKIKDKASQPTQVHGHAMTKAGLFKLAGLLVFLAIASLIVVLLWPYIHELFEQDGISRVTTEVRNAGPAGFLILLAIQFLQIVVVLIPGEAVQIAAGMIYGPWVGALIIVLGCVLSSAFIFVLVKKLGRPFAQAMVSEKHLNRFRDFEKTGKLNIIVFILFLIPGLPKDAFTYITPLTDMRMSTFLLLANLGRLPGIVVSTYAAAGLVRGDITQSVIMFAVLGVIAVACIIGYDRIMKRIEKKTGRDGLELRDIDQ